MDVQAPQADVSRMTTMLYSDRHQNFSQPKKILKVSHELITVLDTVKLVIK